MDTVLGTQDTRLGTPDTGLGTQDKAGEMDTVLGTQGTKLETQLKAGEMGPSFGVIRHKSGDAGHSPMDRAAAGLRSRGGDSVGDTGHRRGDTGVRLAVGQGAGHRRLAVVGGR